VRVKIAPVPQQTHEDLEAAQSVCEDRPGSCMTCRFLRAQFGTPRNDLGMLVSGTCGRFPPQFGDKATKTAMYPTVFVTWDGSWCGEYLPASQGAIAARLGPQIAGSRKGAA
jgi:hypothetical protein